MGQGIRCPRCHGRLRPVHSRHPDGVQGSRSCIHCGYWTLKLPPHPPAPADAAPLRWTPVSDAYPQAYAPVWILAAGQGEAPACYPALWDAEERVWLNSGDAAWPFSPARITHWIPQVGSEPPTMLPASVPTPAPRRPAVIDLMAAFAAEGLPSGVPWRELISFPR